MQQGNLHLNYKTPVLATDGHTIFIAEQGPVTLVFFQAREQNAAGLEADAVAAVRLHSIEELQGLQKSIDEAIKNHKTREP
ncbi:MAG TPA: hypothetical protein VFP32_00655 [Candidatus Saccharimonadales bacterium]|nr:hypothetical protein [Candidatus Saccharimonadales bacterium]